MSCVSVLIPKLFKFFKRKKKYQDDDKDSSYESWEFCSKYPESDRRSKNNISKSSNGTKYESNHVDYEGWEFSSKYPEVDRRSKSNWSKSNESLHKSNSSEKSSLYTNSIASLSISSVKEKNIFGSLNLLDYNDDELYEDVYDDLEVMVI